VTSRAKLAASCKGGHCGRCSARDRVPLGEFAMYLHHAIAPVVGTHLTCQRVFRFAARRRVYYIIGHLLLPVSREGGLVGWIRRDTPAK
jgi:hypothetical protein